MLTLVLLLSIFTPNSSFVFAADKEPTKVLFVGNSYTHGNNMPAIVAAMAQAKGVNLSTQKSTAGGVTLEDHINGKKKLQTLKLIEEGKFDFVVLQDQSMRPAVEPEKTLKYAAAMSAKVNKSGAVPCFYLTWARENNPPMQQKLNATYFKAAKDNQSLLAPVGLAWEKVRQDHPEIKLFAKDGSHPNPLGSYLIAAVFFNTLTDVSPVGLPAELRLPGTNKSLVKVNPKQAAIVQKIAQDTVNQWKARSTSTK